MSQRASNLLLAGAFAGVVLAVVLVWIFNDGKPLFNLH